MVSFNLHDNTLWYNDAGNTYYQNSLVAGRPPSYFQWTKSGGSYDFYTFDHFNQISQQGKCSAIMIESSIIVPTYYRWLYDNAHLFDWIYTHSSQLLELPNTRWIHGGGVWIGTEIGDCEYKIHDKHKLCSIVSSNKVMCDLHLYRRHIAEYINRHHKNIDCYGTLFGNFVKPSHYLPDYMFSIVIENNIDKTYFTEKILNCFATGTIPIYLGATNIGSFFNIDGIVQFTDFSKLLYFIQTDMTSDFYYSRMSSIKQNLELSKQYKCVEDYMWKNYLSKDWS